MSFNNKQVCPEVPVLFTVSLSLALYCFLIQAMAIKEHIGYPDHILEDSNQKLDQEYAHVRETILHTSHLSPLSSTSTQGLPRSLFSPLGLDRFYYIISQSSLEGKRKACIKQ